MTITEVRVILLKGCPPDDSGGGLIAFASVVFDGVFCVRDIKIVIIPDEQGGWRRIVCMPCRKITDRCPFCRMKNFVKARACGDCGAKLDPQRYLLYAKDGQPPRLYADVAHPVVPEFRDTLERAVLEAFERELSMRSYHEEKLQETSS